MVALKGADYIMEFRLQMYPFENNEITENEGYCKHNFRMEFSQ